MALLYMLDMRIHDHQSEGEAELLKKLETLHPR